MTNMLTEHRVGRLALSLPASIQRVRQEHTLSSSVHLREMEWTSSNGYKTAWSDWLHKLAGRSRPQGTREVLIEQRELAPRCQGVLAHDSEHDSNIRTWFALLDAGTHGVWLECAQDQGAPWQALALLKTVVRSYRVLEAQASLQPESWFYLERGAVALPPLRDEHALVLFEGSLSEPSQQLSIRAGPESAPQGGLMRELQRALAMGLHGESTVTILRAGSRRVAGFEGEELIIQVETGGNGHLAWAWSYPGLAGETHAPYIEVSMHSAGGAREAQARLWKTALDSMRHLSPRPHESWLEQL